MYAVKIILLWNGHSTHHLIQLDNFGDEELDWLQTKMFDLFLHRAHKRSIVEVRSLLAGEKVGYDTLEKRQVHLKELGDVHILQGAQKKNHLVSI